MNHLIILKTTYRTDIIIQFCCTNHNNENWDKSQKINIKKELMITRQETNMAQTNYNLHAGSLSHKADFYKKRKNEIKS